MDIRDELESLADGNCKFKTILADPPWTYDNKKTGGSMSSGAEDKYDVMTLDDICDLPVSKVAQNDATLFLWATTPLLPEAFVCLDAWGFKYKTALYWHKPNRLGLGYWFRGGVEVCLVGANYKAKAFRCQKSNFIQAPARKHSQKPDELYEMIESIDDMDHKLELFARTQRPGWTALGNQVGILQE